MNWWTEARRERPGLVLTLGIVLVAHAAVLSRLAGAPPLPVAHGEAGGQSAGPMRVRVISAAAAEAARSTEAAPVATVLPARTSGPAPAPAVHNAVTGTGESGKVGEAPALSGAVPPPMPPITPDPPYVPRGQLTRAPVLLQQMDVPFPDEVSGVVDLTVQISLFIDEEGAVQKVQIDTPQVASPFVEAVQRTFARARFRPGQLHGENVRSLIRAEVEFHAPNARQPGPLRAPAAGAAPATPVPKSPS